MVSYIYISILVVYLLLALMSCMLFRRWKNQLYSFLTLAMLIATVSYGILRYPLNQGDISGFWILLANAFAFVVVQTGLFLLFNQKKHKSLIPYGFMLGAVLAASIVLLLDNFAGSIFLALVSAACSVFLYFWGLPQLPKERLFSISFALHIVISLFAGLFAFWNVEWLLTIIFSAALLQAFVIFMIYFDRMIDVMQTVSVSSVTDGLTGLYNKHYFKRLVAGSIRQSSAVAVIFSDIDNFKRLNDTQGHHVGDAILKLVADILQSVVGSYGVCGRYGGEEMVALITDPNADPALLAEKFRYRVEEETKEVYPVTVSVGYSQYREDDEITADDFIKQADEAMYYSKQQGKNRVSNYAVLIEDDSDFNSDADSFVFN